MLRKRIKNECDDYRTKINPKKIILIYKQGKKDHLSSQLVELVTKLLLGKDEITQSEIENTWSSFEMLSSRMCMAKAEELPDPLIISLESNLTALFESFDSNKNPKIKDKSEHFILAKWALSTCQLAKESSLVKSIQLSKRSVIL